MLVRWFTILGAVTAGAGTVILANHYVNALRLGEAGLLLASAAFFFLGRYTAQSKGLVKTGAALELVGGFALLALTMAAAGIYGVVSHGVLRRTRELGVRLALGATPGSVAWLVVESSLRQVVGGTVAGLAASWAMARWIESLLYGVAGHDLVSFSLPPVVLVAVGLLASLLPMVRAARIDPARSLREG